MVCFRLTTLAATIVGFASFSDAAPLTLRDATKQAIATSPALANATLVLVETEAAQDVERGGHEAIIEVSAGASVARDQPRPTPFSQQLAADALGGAVSIVKRLDTGGEARVTVSAQHAIATTRVPGLGGHSDLDARTLTPRLEASLTQPLWGGRRGESANRDRLAAEREAAVAERSVAAARVLRDVEHAYWQLHLAQRVFEIRRDATTAATAQLEQVEAEIARGSRPRLAAAEIEEEVARRREEELIARSEIGERSLDLARVLGIAPTTELRTSDSPPTRTTAMTRATTALALRSSELREEAAHAAVAKAEDDVRWRIDAGFKGSLAAPRDRMTDALADTVGYGGYTVEATLTLRAPLGERGARGVVGGARAKHLAARIASSDLAAQIATETERLENRRALAVHRRTALDRARELAEQNLAAEQNRWERGDTTSFELLRRQNAVAEVKLRIERTRIDEIDAERALAAISGELLDRHGVKLP